MNIFQLNCFLTVAETLNFARAAERLNITQPAVTHQIRSLESELNVKLFRRSTRSVELTHAGIIFLDDAQKMVGIAIRAQKRFADPAKQEIQPFSIGFQSYTQLLYFPDIWREMRRIYPNLHPGIRIAPVQHLRHLLEEEAIEAFISFREPEVQKKSIHYREIARSRVDCICDLENPLARCDRVSFEQLGGENLVLSSPLQTPVSLVQLQRELIGDRSPAELYFCDTPEEILTLVRSGFGVSPFPALFLPQDPCIARVPMPEVPALSFGVYYKTTQGNEPLRRFIQFLHRGVSPAET